MHKRYTIQVRNESKSPLSIRTHIQLELAKPLAAMMKRAKMFAGTGQWTLKILPGSGAEMEYLTSSGKTHKKRLDELFRL